MDIQLLRSFVTIAETGSITRATRGLHLTQPAISGQLKALEEQLGLRLFDRTPQGMVLTHAGDTLLSLAQRVLDAEAELLVTAGRLTGAIAGRVKLGISSNPAHLRLAELFEEIAAAYPALVVEIHHGTSGSVVAGVREGRLDVALVVGAQAGNGLPQARLKSLVVYVAAPAKWREEIATQGWGWVMSRPWVLGAEDTFCGQAARDCAKDAARLIEVDHPGAVLDLVTAGACAGILHEEDAGAAERAGAVVLWKERPLTTELRAVWNGSGAAAATAMVSVLRGIWAGAEPSRDR